MRWQDAVTCEQVLLKRTTSCAAPRVTARVRRTLDVAATAAVLALLVILTGCAGGRPAGLAAPYAERKVFAVAPLRNESGSLAADGIRLADRLTEQLTLTRRVDTVPVNRVLAAMEAGGMASVTGRGDAMRLLRALDVDALVVGTVTAYDPYDPPKVGLNVDLYMGEALTTVAMDIRLLSRAATDRGFNVDGDGRLTQPVTSFSALWDAGHPVTQDRLAAYAVGRGTDYGSTSTEARLFRISMDLYSGFVAFEAARRLMDAELLRLTLDRVAQQPAPAPDPTTSSIPRTL